MSGVKERVLVAMSGGVDSSVAAALLLQCGYEVVGITLRLWTCDGTSTRKTCCGIDQVEDARAVADRLEFPHYTVDGREQFEDQVLRRAWTEYNRGRTPNPCILCNEHIKFGVFLEHAKGLGAVKIATGHHARISAGKGLPGPMLRRGKDGNKDQSYFLFSLSPRQLGMALLPIGDFTKEEVRSMARNLGLSIADKAESQDACLPGEDGSFSEALRKRFGAGVRPGPLVDPSGSVLGMHQGIHRFTVGQRRGLGVALGRPAYVQAIRPARNEVVVSCDEDGLLAGGLIASGVRWSDPPEPDGAVEAAVQIRYRHRAEPALIEDLGNDRVRVRFSRPQRAVTPGQAAVFYREELVLGGGWIESTVEVKEYK